MQIFSRELGWSGPAEWFLPAHQVEQQVEVGAGVVEVQQLTGDCGENTVYTNVFKIKQS